MPPSQPAVLNALLRSCLHWCTGREIPTTACYALPSQSVPSIPLRELC
jgi:hypothetical protein